LLNPKIDENGFSLASFVKEKERNIGNQIRYTKNIIKIGKKLNSMRNLK